MGKRGCAVLSASDGGVLGAVLTNPPTSRGDRTIRRVELAAELLGYSKVQTANLFTVATVNTAQIDELGVEPRGWLDARPALAALVGEADGLLFAYGVREPNGPARAHFRDQVSWLSGQVYLSGLPTWWVGDGSRHPSRWQRWTHRAHPELPFQAALKRSLVQVSGLSVGAPD